MKINKVILLTIDLLRYDRLGVAGYPLSLTPTLDALAQSGIYCTQAISETQSFDIRCVKQNNAREREIEYRRCVELMQLMRYDVMSLMYIIKQSY